MVLYYTVVIKLFFWDFSLRDLISTTGKHLKGERSKKKGSILYNSLGFVLVFDCPIVV